MGWLDQFVHLFAPKKPGTVDITQAKAPTLADALKPIGSMPLILGHATVTASQLDKIAAGKQETVSAKLAKPAIINPPGFITRHKWPTQAQLRTYSEEFDGDPRKPGWVHSHTVDVEVPWKLLEGNTHVNHILINIKCADSLKEILDVTWDMCNKSQDAMDRDKCNLYSGSYVLRPMRGGSALSMHAHARAIDWADQFNQQHDDHGLFTKDTLLISNFIRGGWTWGGFWSDPEFIDKMHVQGADVH
jgi:hypothetical protein